ncbi:MAG: LysR family transcriptional regulator [Sphingobium sp.]|nr:LysR family transcriptional regulator [Sphingobium sp.]
MKLQQLRYVAAAAHHDLNLTAVANQLFISQSGISRQIRELEAELGIDIFVRRGRRLVGLTEAGAQATEVIAAILREADNLKRLSSQFFATDRGYLTIAATHNQASYVLPSVLLRFAREFPHVAVELRQGTPRQVADMLLKREADFGLATEAVSDTTGLLAVPCFDWHHVAIVPEAHALTRLASPSLADIADFPIVTYNSDFSGGRAVAQTFTDRGFDFDLRLTAMDAEFIKTYVRLGMGVGIVAEMAMINGDQTGLVTLPGSHRLFPRMRSKVALLKGSLLHNYAYDLIAMLAPRVPRAVLTATRSFRQLEDPSSFSERTDLHIGGPDFTIAASRHDVP